MADDSKIITPEQFQDAMRKQITKKLDPQAQASKQLQQAISSIADELSAQSVVLKALVQYLDDIGLLRENKLVEERPELFDMLNLPADFPKRTFPNWVSATAHRAHVIQLLNTAHAKGSMSLVDVVKKAIEFNEDDENIFKIDGLSIPVIEYLSNNPEELDQDQLDELAGTFGLYRNEEKEDDTEESTTEGELKESV